MSEINSLDIPSNPTYKVPIASAPIADLIIIEPMVLESTNLAEPNLAEPNILLQFPNDKRDAKQRAKRKQRRDTDKQIKEKQKQKRKQRKEEEIQRKMRFFQNGHKQLHNLIIDYVNAYFDFYTGVKLRDYVRNNEYHDLITNKKTTHIGSIIKRLEYKNYHIRREENRGNPSMCNRFNYHHVHVCYEIVLSAIEYFRDVKYQKIFRMQLEYVIGKNNNILKEIKKDLYSKYNGKYRRTKGHSTTESCGRNYEYSNSLEIKDPNQYHKELMEEWYQKSLVNVRDFIFNLNKNHGLIKYNEY